MGSIFSPKVPAPPPPPETPELTAFRSEVQGIERVPVVGPDGKTTIIERALPLSEEDQAAKDNLQRIADENLARYEALATNFDVDQIPGLSNTLNIFRKQREQIVRGGYETRTNQEERSLARFGVEDSTSATQLRQQRGQDLQASLKAVGDETEMLKQNVRQTEMGNSLNLFGLATGRQDVAASQAIDALNRGSQTQMGLANMQNSVNLATYQGGLQQQQMQYQANQAGIQNMMAVAGLATMGMTGGFGSMGGGSINASQGAAIPWKPGATFM